MGNQELREILIKELGIGELPEEAQDEIVVKLGEVILKSLTVAIFEKLSAEARVEFEKIGAKGDHALIQEFLEENIPETGAQRNSIWGAGPALDPPFARSGPPYA